MSGNVAGANNVEGFRNICLKSARWCRAAPRIGEAGALGASRTGRGAVMGRVVDPAPRIGGRGDSASIDQDAVARVLQAHTAEVSACYETALLSHEGLKGTARLEWRIDGSGNVASARLLRGTLQDGGAVTSCIIAKLKTWRFPASRGGQVIVSNNFVFQQAASSDVREGGLLGRGLK